MQATPAEPGPPGLAWGFSSGFASLESRAPHRPLSALSSDLDPAQEAEHC